MEVIRIERALVSVSDKTGLVDFCRKLIDQGIELLSTGGTHATLMAQGIPVREVSDLTEFPEMMDGRLKTLHPRVHGGLLGRRGPVWDDLDADVMNRQGILPIDLLVVNLYPFEDVVARSDCSVAEAIENIDIGGPAMVRSAAKNYASVAVIVDVDDYLPVSTELAKHGHISAETRFNLARKAFARIAAYDAAISNYLGSLDEEGAGRQLFPATLTRHLVMKEKMRYGENPHQQAAFYADPTFTGASLVNAHLLQGKALSYNNVADADTALECVSNFAEPACVIVKHANPCGVAVAEDLVDCYRQAFRTDPTSAFGGVIALNRELTASLASLMIENQFLELLIVPAVEKKALKVLASRKNLRLLRVETALGDTSPGMDFKKIRGGVLVQEADSSSPESMDLKVVTHREPTEKELIDLKFAWDVARFVKSNAIVYARDQHTVGIGAGQMSRVYSAKIAALKAADENIEVLGSVMASDAFFPFRDSIDTAAAIGITAVIQPGGSIRDKEVIAAADEAGMAMILTGIRHFRH